MKTIEITDDCYNYLEEARSNCDGSDVGGQATFSEAILGLADCLDACFTKINKLKLNSGD